MRRKKKEALDDIVQMLMNDNSGKCLACLLDVAEAVQKEKRTYGKASFESKDCQKILKKIDWLYGYESEIADVFEFLKSKLEQKIFSKDSSHVTLISCIACFCTLSSILNPGLDDGTNWEEKLAQGNRSKKLSDCLEILKRHCPEKIDVGQSLGDGSNRQ